MTISDATLTSLKTPPHSIEAEQFLIGGILLDEYAYENIAGTFQESELAGRRMANRPDAPGLRV